MMATSRRSFLKRASGLVVAAVAAPLYIPAERLAFGVPRPLAVAPTILLPAITYTLRTHNPAWETYTIKSELPLSVARFDAPKTLTVTQITVDFGDGRPSLVENIAGITLMAGDSLDVRFNEAGRSLT